MRKFKPLVGGWRRLLPENFGQTDRVGAKSPIFDLFSPVALSRNTYIEPSKTYTVPTPTTRHGQPPLKVLTRYSSQQHFAKYIRRPCLVGICKLCRTI